MTEEKRKRWTMTEWISQSWVEQPLYRLYRQFVRAVSHSVGAHTAALQPATDSDSNGDVDADERRLHRRPTTAWLDRAAAAADEPADCCEVCLVAPREGFALVPCGHARFCESCVNIVATLGCCPVPCAVQTSAWWCVSSCSLNTDTFSDRTSYWL